MYINRSRVNHLYHLVKPSPWPVLSAGAALVFLSALAGSMHSVKYGFFFLNYGLGLLLICALFWFQDIIVEGTYVGLHTKIVRAGLKRGFIYFLVSEVMLFFGFFWAFFHSALSPAIAVGTVWPPKGISIIETFYVPTINTALLIVSGFTITWAHRGFAIGSFLESLDSIFLTLMLGIIFIYFQAKEYYISNFNLSDGVFSSTFFMLTGLHGLHVIVGASFIIVCTIRLCLNHFLKKHYLGFVCAIWYWHFVDAVWIVLFLALYTWGNWS